MHRSGTTLISRMLSRLGLFQGNDIVRNHESLFFFRLNEWVLKQAGTTWDNPAPFDIFLRTEKARVPLAEYIEYVVTGWRSSGFIGKMNYFRGKRIDLLDIPWGWKDPRNTITLPLWTDIFPGAKIIHIFRHGVDVASSLKVREEEIASNRLARFRKHMSLGLYSFYMKKDGFVNSPRCDEIEGGFSLWKEYTRYALDITRTQGDRVLPVRYEDFLYEPVAKLREMSEFCGLEPSDALLRSLSAEVDPGRAFAYRDNESLVEFAEKVIDDPLLEELGY